MRIEDEIKQARFADEWVKCIVNIMFTCNWIEDKEKEVLKEYNLTLQQYNVLRILRGQLPNSVSTSDIRERMIDRASDTSRIVDRLDEKGFVEKKQSRTDRRLVDVKISAQGLEILTQLDVRRDELNAIVGNLSEEEAHLLNSLLDKIRSKE